MGGGASDLDASAALCDTGLPYRGFSRDDPDGAESKPERLIACFWTSGFRRNGGLGSRSLDLSGAPIAIDASLLTA